MTTAVTFQTVSKDRPATAQLERASLRQANMEEVDLQQVNLVGADVVEYAPQNDPVRTFGYVAAGLSWKILCWLAADVKRRNGGVNHPTEWPMALGNVTL